ncbi:hypothetical protein FM076_09325 [Streptomyces albus subsp. chlorinus]|uniref:hypothetical protein n=1 Tax=Streptomyces albus TaxID=1888 RepID=UPI00156F0218|nr:hypothetical protein [Streptomyces albus]NSC21395.1 hypothetical protein [Streptomyces albus subsp. chlorinus]
MSLTGDWVKPDDPVGATTPAEAIRSHNTREKPRKYPGRYEVATWRGGAVAALDCRRSSNAVDRSVTRYLLDLRASDTPLNDNPDQAHKVFGKLAQEAMAEVAGKLPCVNGAGGRE